MTRFVSWIGWAAAACMLVATLIVAHALTRPHRYDMPSVALRSGATLERLDDGGVPHLVVTSLQSGGAGEAAGLRVGDRIEDVDGLPAPTIAAFNKDVVSGSHSDIDLRVRRGGTLLDIHMKREIKG